MKFLVSQLLHEQHMQGQSMQMQGRYRELDRKVFGSSTNTYSHYIPS